MATIKISELAVTDNDSIQELSKQECKGLRGGMKSLFDVNEGNGPVKPKTFHQWDRDSESTGAIAL